MERWKGDKDRRAFIEKERKDGKKLVEILKSMEFDAVFGLLEKNFPQDEYRTCEEQRKLLLKREYNIYCVRNPENEGLIGFAAVWDFLDTAYIEHLAVASQYRNQGIGGKILGELKRYFPKRICLEVEPPDNDTARKRIKFYEKNHFFFHPYPYIQPPISAGRREIPLYIMTSEKELRESEFEKIKRLLYTNVYRVKYPAS